MLELLDLLKPYATIISALSAFVSAIAVVLSTGFVIWTTFFRENEKGQDRRFEGGDAGVVRRNTNNPY